MFKVKIERAAQCTQLLRDKQIRALTFVQLLPSKHCKQSTHPERSDDPDATSYKGQLRYMLAREQRSIFHHWITNINGSPTLTVLSKLAVVWVVTA